MPALVSVVIPAYRDAALLHRAVASVIAQDYHNIEIIVVDDASKNGLIQQIDREFPGRLKFVILSRNGGPSVARNEGIAAASGEFVAFLDHDDVWSPNHLSAHLAALQRDSSAVFSAADALIIDLNGIGVMSRPVRKQKYVDAATHILHEGLIMSMSQVVVRRRGLDQAGPLDPQLVICHDRDLWFRLLRFGGLAHATGTTVTKFTQPGSLSRNRKRLADEIALVNERFFDYPGNRRYRVYRDRIHVIQALRSVDVALGNHEFGEALDGAARAFKISVSAAICNAVQYAGRKYLVRPILRTWG